MGRSILVRGSANIDEFFHVPHIVKPGETIASTRYAKRAGGKGANVAAGCGRAGANVTFVGSVGEDGDIIIDELQHCGVDVEHVQRSKDLPTGRAIIQLDSTGENSIVILAGANSRTKVEFPNLEPYDLLLVQNEIPLGETLGALREAKRAGILTLFNPSPMPSEEDLIKFAWNNVDLIIVNEGECDALCRGLGSQSTATGLQGLESIEALQHCIGFVMTKGSRGAEASVKVGGKWQRSSSPAGRVERGVKDTTGAGDCFTAYLTSMLTLLPNPRSPTMEEMDDVLRLANQASALCVEGEGTIASMPKLEDVERRCSTDKPWPAFAKRH